MVREWRVVTGRRSDWGGAVGAGLRWVAEVGAKRPGAAAVPASVPVGAGRSGGAGDGGQERSPVRAWQLFRELLSPQSGPRRVLAL